jgi:hypothetical protein
LDKVLFKVATAPTCCLVLTFLGFLMWNQMRRVCFAWGEECDESLFCYEQIGGGFITDP